MSVVALLAYLLLAPFALDEAEQEFQKKMAFVRNPQAHWTEMAEAVNKVRADDKLMESFRAFAKAEAAITTTPDSEK